MASLPPRPGGSDQRGGAPVQPPLQPSSSVPLQLPIHLALHNPLLPLGSGAGLAGGGGSVGMHAAPRAAYLAFPFVQQPGTAGGPTAATTIQLPHFQLPVAGGGGAALGGLQLGWPMGSGGGAAAAAAAPPPAASLAGWQPGLVLHTQAQMQAASDEHQRRLQQHQVRRQRRLAKHGRPVLPQPSPESDPIPRPSCEQAAQSAPAPQIMSNTDVGGSTEGTQAYDAARAGGRAPLLPNPPRMASPPPLRPCRLCPRSPATPPPSPPRAAQTGRRSRASAAPLPGWLAGWLAGCGLMRSLASVVSW